MVSLTAAEDADRAVALLAGHGIHAWVAGTVDRGRRPATAAGCTLYGDHAEPADGRDGSGTIRLLSRRAEVRESPPAG